MFKNIFKITIFFISIVFFGLVYYEYSSDDYKKKIITNRDNFEELKLKNPTSVPILLNDTNNVIEFNDGYSNMNKKKDRMFWELFKK